MEVLDQVKEIVAKVCEVEVSQVTENTAIGDFPNWDSIGHLTILSTIEEVLGISFEPEEVISRCVQIKADYVSGDEFDNGIRRKLNLGHTFGHALEALSDYRMTHGQAVAAGMCIAARASFKMGFCKQACVDGIESCIGHFKLPVRSQEEPERMIPFIAADKKRRGNSVSLIVPVRIGRCDIIQVPTSEIGAWIKAGM